MKGSTVKGKEEEPEEEEEEVESVEEEEEQSAGSTKDEVQKLQFLHSNACSQTASQSSQSPPLIRSCPCSKTLADPGGPLQVQSQPGITSLGPDKSTSLPYIPKGLALVFHPLSQPLFSCSSAEMSNCPYCACPSTLGLISHWLSTSGKIISPLRSCFFIQKIAVSWVCSED